MKRATHEERWGSEFSELGVLAMAGLVVVGAFVGPSLPVTPLPVLLLGFGLAVLVRSPTCVVVVVVLLAATRSNEESARYQPLEPRPYDGIAQLITDPEPTDLGSRAEIKLDDGSRVRLSVYGSLAADLSDSAAGDRLEVAGELRPVEPSRWLQSRHLVGALNPRRVHPIDEADWFRQPSEWLRSAVRSGASHLPSEHRSLYLGLVIGDDREQSAAQQARFRTAGLAHLLAVSGQNVAFVLTVTAPLLRRIGRRSRFAVIVTVLGIFALATRLEASVVRATATAGLAAWAAVSGRRSTGLRLLGLAVTVLVLIDPFLVRSISFQLSVAASGSIVALGPVIADRLRGPTWVVEAAAVTLAAQIGVAPILLATFGPISLATIPANVMAGWAAGLVMVWGMSVGLVVGGLPDAIAEAVQRPAGWLVAWIDLVGTWGAAAPLPRLDGAALPWFLGAVVSVWLTRNHRRIRRVVLALIAMVGVMALPSPPSGSTELLGGGRWFPSMQDDPSVLVVNSSADQRLIESLVEHRIRSIDIIVITGSSRPAGRLGNEIVDLVAPGVVLAPGQHRVHDGQRVLEPMVIQAGDWVIEISPSDDRLDVTAIARQALDR